WATACSAYVLPAWARNRAWPVNDVHATDVSEKNPPPGSRYTLRPEKKPDPVPEIHMSVLAVKRYQTVCVENEQKKGSPLSVVASFMTTVDENGSAATTVAVAKLSFGGGAARATPSVTPRNTSRGSNERTAGRTERTERRMSDLPIGFPRPSWRARRTHRGSGRVVRRGGPAADAGRGNSGGDVCMRQGPGMVRSERPADLREEASVTAAVTASGALARGMSDPVRPGKWEPSTRWGGCNRIVRTTLSVVTRCTLRPGAA